MIDYVIDTDNVSIAYKLYNTPKDRLKEALSLTRKKYHREFYALKNISCKVPRGQVVGIVGKNGAGKSTLLKIIAGILQPSSGKLSVKGKIFALLELGAGFNPEFTGMENIYFYGMIHDIAKDMMDELVNDIVDFTNIGTFIDQPLKTYSTGMRARLAFAVATAVEPEILIIDEILSVGDVQFQRKSYTRMEKLIEGGTTVLYVSHSHQSIVEICSRVLMIRNGELVLDGSSRNVVNLYLKSLDSKEEIPTDKLRIELDNLESGKKDGDDNHNEQVEAQEKSIALSGELANDDGQLKKTAASMVELRNADVSLEKIFLEGDSGVVSTLDHEGIYNLCVTFYFEEEIVNAVFPFWITTKQGIYVSGIRYPDDNSVINKIEKDSSVTIKWSFCASMMQGDYFITVGVTSVNNGEKHGVYRANDALVFKVVNFNRKVQWGLVSLGQKVLDFTIEKTKKNN